jgi:hypothetical protein
VAAVVCRDRGFIQVTVKQMSNLSHRQTARGRASYMVWLLASGLSTTQRRGKRPQLGLLDILQLGFLDILQLGFLDISSHGTARLSA